MILAVSALACLISFTAVVRRSMRAAPSVALPRASVALHWASCALLARCRAIMANS